jgi:surface protein
MSTDITSLDLSSWKLSDGVDIHFFCADCYSLTDLDISTWDLSKTYGDIVLWGVPLVNFRCGYNLRRNFALEALSNLTLESLLSVLNGLYDFTGNGETPDIDSGESILYMGEGFNDRLTEEHIAIATNKGWTVY